MKHENLPKPPSVPYGDTTLRKREKLLISAHAAGVVAGVGTTTYTAVELVRGNFVHALIGTVLVAGEAAVLVLNAKKAARMMDESTERSRKSASLPNTQKDIR